MRFFFLYAFMAAIAFVKPAAADQTDPSLKVLFQELRDGSVLSADKTTERIVEIWARPANGSAAVLYERAEIALLNDDLELATTLVGHMTGLSPSFAQGWMLKASIDQSAGRLQAAMDSFAKVVALEPRHFLAHIAIADMYLRSEKKREAFDAYQKALEWNPHLEYARDQAAKLLIELDGQEI